MSRFTLTWNRLWLIWFMYGKTTRNSQKLIYEMLKMNGMMINSISKILLRYILHLFLFAILERTRKCFAFQITLFLWIYEWIFCGNTQSYFYIWDFLNFRFFFVWGDVLHCIEIFPFCFVIGILSPSGANKLWENVYLKCTLDMVQTIYRLLWHVIKSGW